MILLAANRSSTSTKSPEAGRAHLSKRIGHSHCRLLLLLLPHPTTATAQQSRLLPSAGATADGRSIAGFTAAAAVEAADAAAAAAIALARLSVRTYPRRRIAPAGVIYQINTKHSPISTGSFMSQATILRPKDGQENKEGEGELTPSMRRACPIDSGLVSSRTVRSSMDRPLILL